MADGRVRGGGERGYQGVSMKDNWRTPWLPTKAAAQKALDKHLNGEPKKAAKPKQQVAREPALHLPAGGFHATDAE